MNNHEANHIINLLRSNIENGNVGLDTTPFFIKKLINTGAWKKRTLEMSGKTVEFDNFIEFCESQPMSGLGFDFALVKKLCKEDNEVVKLLDDLNRRGPGKTWDSRTQDNNLYNVQDNSKQLAPTGNSKEALLRKLEKHAPEMLDKVLAGEISPNAACIKAGLKKKTLQIPDDPKKAAEKIRKHFKGEDFNIFVEHLTEICNI
jgi:hypothetical protein